MVRKVGLAPTMFLVWRVYSPLPSLLGDLRKNRAGRTGFEPVVLVLETSGLHVNRTTHKSGGAYENRTRLDGLTIRSNYHYTNAPLGLSIIGFEPMNTASPLRFTTKLNR
jgi:hypothetical protein